MRIGILCAGDRESAPFIPMIDGCRVREKAMLKFYEGTMENVSVAALFSGVCKVNAAIAAQILIDTFHCDAIISAGTCGGMDPELDVYDTVVATETAYHDVAENILTEFHPWMDSIWFKSDEKLLAAAKNAAVQVQTKVVFGRMVTGEQFIVDENREAILRKFEPLSVDMETAAIAHACYVNSIPFLAVRTITDTPRRRGTAEFEANCERASQIAANVVRRILGSIQ